MQRIGGRWTAVGMLIVGLLALVLVVQQSGDTGQNRPGVQPPAGLPTPSGVVRDASPVVTSTVTATAGVQATVTALATATIQPSATLVSIPAETPSPDESDDQVAGFVVQYLQSVGAVRSGTIDVRYSQPLYQQQLIDLGLAMVPLAPDCLRPLHLVIVAGDFDINGLVPGWRDQEPASFIGFVHDDETGVFGQIMPSYTGSIFKAALQDPALPDPRPDEVFTFDFDTATECETTYPEGGPGPDASPAP